MWRLFLDDDPRRDYLAGDAVIARSYDEAVALILERGCPQSISFDNDLGEPPPKEGRDLARWLVEADMDGVIHIPDDFDYFAHSANPVAWEPIEGILRNYLEFRSREKGQSE